MIHDVSKQILPQTNTIIPVNFPKKVEGQADLMGCISLIFAYVFQRNAKAKSWFILPAVGDKALGPGVVSRFCLHGDDPIDGISKMNQKVIAIPGL